MRYYVGLVIAIVAISFTAILIRLADAAALTIATWRMVVTVLLLLPALFAFERPGLMALTAKDLVYCALSGMFLALHFALWTVSLDYTSVASSVVFVSTQPIFVALFAHFLFQEKLTFGVVGGIALTLLGAVLIGIHDLQVGGESLLGDLLATGGAVALVGYLLLGKAVRNRQGFLLYSVLVYSACALGLAVIGIFLNTPLLSFSQRDLVLFLALAVATLGGHTVFNWVLKHLPASVVAVSFVGEPAGAALLAWLILGESLGVLTAVGGLAMLAGIYLAAKSS